MKICIIGWYGTETIGDRAILAGIFSVLGKAIDDFSITIGALNPILTERTICEDNEFFYKSAGKNISISCFDSTNPSDLRQNIARSDVLMVGGGPLMDLQEMYMLDYAFCFARSKHIKTVLMGCGWGPLTETDKISIALRLVDNSDLTIFRDANSKQQYLEYTITPNPNVYSLIDPAVIASIDYLGTKKNFLRANDNVAINFRDVSIEGTHYTNTYEMEDVFVSLVNNITQQTSLPILLVPMHTFSIGGDDRIILDKVAKRCNNPNVHIQQAPLSTEETMDVYYNAQFCVGMRFHSILLQTILNGRNFILDYTHPTKGKIVGLLNQLNLFETYSKRYFSLQSGEGAHPEMWNIDNIAQCTISDSLHKYKDSYISIFESTIL